VKLRESVRALILDENDATLLLRFDWDGLDVPGGFWANPGGGMEDGESRTEALARELEEEVGLRLDGLGPEIWTKTAVFPMPDWDGQVDHIHLVRVQHFVPRPRLTPEELRAENVHEIRWWTREELAGSSAAFAPRELPTLLDTLVSGGVPSEPVVLTGF
jgi:8-oxo-dGTP diphosphatase